MLVLNPPSLLLAIYFPKPHMHCAAKWLLRNNAVSIICRHVQVAEVDVLVPTTGPVDSQAIRNAKKLKLIVQPATGYSNIDIETAAEFDVPVCTSPGGALHSFPVTSYTTISRTHG